MIGKRITITPFTPPNQSKFNKYSIKPEDIFKALNNNTKSDKVQAIAPLHQPKKVQTSYATHKFNSIYPNSTIGPKLNKQAVAPHPKMLNIKRDSRQNPFQRIHPVSRETVVPSVNFTEFNSSMFYTESRVISMVKQLIVKMDSEYPKLKEIRKMSREMDKALWKKDLVRVYEFCSLLDKVGSLDLEKQAILQSEGGNTASLNSFGDQDQVVNAQLKLLDFELPPNMKQGFFTKEIVLFNRKVMKAFNKNYFWVLEHDGPKKQPQNEDKRHSQLELQPKFQKSPLKSIDFSLEDSTDRTQGEDTHQPSIIELETPSLYIERKQNNDSVFSLKSGLSSDLANSTSYKLSLRCQN